jgi:hypothetical protein
MYMGTYFIKREKNTKEITTSRASETSLDKLTHRFSANREQPRTTQEEHTRTHLSYQIEATTKELQREREREHNTPT